VASRVVLSSIELVYKHILLALSNLFLVVKICSYGPIAKQNIKVKSNVVPAFN
jgi:hypothetical protein